MSVDSRLEALESWLRLHRSRILLLIAVVALAAAAWLYPSVPTAVAERRPRLEIVPGSPSPKPSPRRPSPSPTSAGPRPSPAPPPLATSRPTHAWVHVAGAVARPGVVRLPLDARAFQAVQAAGGLLADADLDRVNLARRVEDGGMIVVPRRDEPTPRPDTPPADSPSPAPLDLNAATADQLAALPGLGPTRAAAIVAERERGGPYRSVADLGRVPGMGPRLVARMEPLVRVVPPVVPPEEGALPGASNRIP